MQEGLRASRPRAGGGRHGDLITARLKYHQFLMDKGMDSKEAFNKTKDLTIKDLKKLGYPNFNESVVDAEDGVMDALENGNMSKDEVFGLIKKEYGLKRHEFNQAWAGLMDDGDIVKVGGNKYRRN